MIERNGIPNLFIGNISPKDLIRIVSKKSEDHPKRSISFGKQISIYPVLTK